MTKERVETGFKMWCWATVSAGIGWEPRPNLQRIEDTKRMASIRDGV